MRRKFQANGFRLTWAVVSSAVLVGAITTAGEALAQSQPKAPEPESRSYSPSIPSSFLNSAAEYRPGSRGLPPAPPPMPAADITELPLSWTALGADIAPGDDPDFEATLTSGTVESTAALESTSLPLSAMPPEAMRPSGPMFEESTAAMEAVSMPATLASFQPPPAMGPPFAESTEQLQAFGNMPPPNPEAFGPPARFQQWRQSRLQNRSYAWGVALDAVMFTEGSKPSGIPGFVSDDTSGAIEIAPGTLPHNYGYGPRLTLSHYHSDATEIQVSYFGIYSWDRTQVVQDFNNLSLAGDIALATEDFRGADSFTVNYSTEINNVEANILQSLFTPTRSWLVGFRYINWIDRLQFRAVDADSGTSDMYVRSTNNLFGGQFGVDQAVDNDWGRTVVKLRGGMFGNMASSKTFLADFDNQNVLRDVNPTASAFTVMGETGLYHTLSPSDNISVRFGYTMMWFEGLARGPAQVDLTDTGTSSTVVDKTNSIFMHGATVGITLRW